MKINVDTVYGSVKLAADALDEMVDKGLGDCFLVSEEDQAKAIESEREEYAHLGNAGEAADLNDCWMAEVAFNYVTDCQLIAAFAEARGANADTLEDYVRNMPQVTH